MTDRGETIWPELLGVDVDEAEQVIRRERPNLRIQVGSRDSAWTADDCLDRVRLLYDPGIRRVALIASIG